MPSAGRAIVRLHKRLDVTTRRRSELTAEFATDLRRTLVACPESGIRGIEIHGKHQLARFVQAELLLKLQRASSTCAIGSDGGTATRPSGRQRIDAQWCCEV